MTEVGVQPMLAGRYHLGRVIGTGGMARVHCGTDTVLGRTVAIKVFRLDADPAQLGRIENESRALAAVQHPGLVSVYDAGTWTTDGTDVPFLVMEFVDGPTLAEACAAGALAVSQVVQIGAGLAEALAHVHERGIVHRDVKPANILLSGGHTPKLTDFGIARLVDSASHTQTGTLIGTAAYLSPEQVQGREVGPATDIFALGLVLLEAATGRREYQGNTVETALARLERLPVVPDALPAPLQRLLVRMTAANPEERPTATQVNQALRADLTGPSLGTVVLPSPATAVATVPRVVAAPAEAVPGSYDIGAGRSQPAGGVFGEAIRDAARSPWFLAGVMSLIVTVAVVLALLSSGGAGSAGTTPSQVPGSQLEKDLSELRDAVTP